MWKGAKHRKNALTTATVEGERRNQRNKEEKGKDEKRKGRNINGLN